MDQKLWVLEVFRRSLDKGTCARAIEVDLTKVPKSGRRRRKMEKASRQKWGTRAGEGSDC